MLRHRFPLLAHHSLRELLGSVSRHYTENKLHELPDETILSYGRLRRIPIVGTRDDIIKRLYRYLYRRECSEPVNIICYDLEFTGLPTWDESGRPNQEIIEIGAFAPAKNARFSCLVKPESCPLTDEAAALTQISSSILEADGIPVADALRKFYAWLSTCIRAENPHIGPTDSMSVPNGRPTPVSADLPTHSKPSTAAMLISHGGALHDIRMLKYYSKAAGVRIPDAVFFADSMRLLKECTQNKGDKLGVLRLDSLLRELDITSSGQGHRALADAISTWRVVEKAICRYSSTHLTPTQDMTKKYLQWRKM